MALEALTAAITANAVVTADLTEVSVARSTKQIIEVLYIEGAGVRALNVNIEASALVTGVILALDYTVDFTAEAIVIADLTGIWGLTSDISAEAVVNVELLSYKRMNAAITADGDVAVNIRKNIRYLDASIIASGDITLVEFDVAPERLGNTLNLTHSATVEKVLSFSIEDTLNLQHQASLVYGLRFLSISSQVLFTHSATFALALPTQTASSTLSFSHSAVPFRELNSYLVLQQEATVTTYFIEGTASSVLNLTDLVSLAGSVFNLPVESQLNLTQLATANEVRNLSASSNLTLSQNVFAIVLPEKKYILLQAPFELIQTSVVLPNPLLDDNESLISNLTLRRSMDNTPRTYVQTSKNKRLRYTFILNRLKALELEAFFNSYNGADIKMLNWKGQIWKVKLITNPIDYVQTRRAEPGGDRTDVNVEFEGVLLNG